MKNTHPSLKYLKSVLSYDPQTGVFTWACDKSLSVRKGRVAGYRRPPQFYVIIGLDGVSYYAHTLAWFYMTGKWPNHVVDHRDRNNANNKWGNLRRASRTQNAQNRRLNADSTTGLKGVSKQAGKYRAQIQANGKRYSLGMFKTPEAASAAYRRAAKRYHEEFANV